MSSWFLALRVARNDGRAKRHPGRVHEAAPSSFTQCGPRDALTNATDVSRNDSRGAVTVVVVDDHAGFRAALEAALRATDGVVVGSAGDGEQAIAMVARLDPDVVVMDLVMPGLSGVQATRRVCANRRRPAVVALSGSRELMRDAVAAGAAACVLKDADPVHLIAAIRAAAAT
jgi:CheY-like chemotaxis protein